MLWIEICFGLVDKNWEDYVSIEENFSSEYKTLVSNPERMINLGWQPQIDIRSLAKKMLTNQ
jgi:GDP-D-mannose dehydratase